MASKSSILSSMFLGLILSLSSLHGTERAPWFSRNLELQPKMAYTYQTYNSFNTNHRPKSHGSDNSFLNVSLSGAYAQYSMEIEVNAAATRHRMFTCSDITLTGRYQLLDDVVADPVSLTVGLSLAQVFKLALHDLSCFYHGGFQGEIDVAVGKELSCDQSWQSRWWGILGFGVADHGSPWVRGDLNWEKNWEEVHRVRLGLESLWGLGHRGLQIQKHFRGYGPVRHQSIDALASYTYATDCYGIWTVGCGGRLYALNCPRGAVCCSISLLYPFGL